MSPTPHSISLRIRISTFVTSFFLASLLAQGAPQLSVVPSQVDFGVVNQHGLTSRTLEIRNTGDSPAEFQGIEIGKSFGFFIYQLADEEVPPGASTPLVIWLDSSSMFGNIGECVEILSNDPENPVIPVCSKVVVERPIRITPPVVRFHDRDAPHEIASVILVNAAANGYTSARLERDIPGLTLTAALLKSHIALTLRANRVQLPASPREIPPEVSLLLEGEGKPPLRKTLAITVDMPPPRSADAGR